MNAHNKHFMILSLISFQRVSDVSLQILLPVFIIAQSWKLHLRCSSEILSSIKSTD